MKLVYLEEKVSNIGVVYKIQLGTYLESMLDADIFKEMEVEEVLVHGTYKYFASAFDSKLEADKQKMKFRSGKFPGAFIVAFYQGKQISVKEALNLQNK